MSSLRPLRGGCHCGRNNYIINVPQDTNESVQVLFNADSVHLSPLATPLAAFLRVPLTWYQSTTESFFPDETHTMIRRVFESQSPSQHQSKRQFCGFCGTPLSYWTERPQTEAGFIQLTLASLCKQDLRDLEDMGYLPSSDASTPNAGSEGDMDVDAITPGAGSSLVQREVSGVPWFNSMMAGSRLGKIQGTRGAQGNDDGKVRVEWEFFEWKEDNNDQERGTRNLDDTDMSNSSGKRKLGDRDDADVAQ